MWRKTCLARSGATRRVAPRGGSRRSNFMVVDFVVAILAALAMPVYVGIQAHAKSVVVGYQTDNQSLPAAISEAALGAYGFRTTTVAWSPSPPAAASPLCLVITSSAGSASYATDQLGVSAADVAPAGC